VNIGTIAILGAGAWGTALANCAARAGNVVILWGRDPAAMARLSESRESPRLPGLRLDDGIAVTGALEDVTDADAALLVVPTQAVRQAATDVADMLAADTPIVVCAKGIERGTHLFVTDIITQCAPAAVPAILSGPSFAADVARGLPTAVTLACRDETIAAALAQTLGSATFRPYHSTDVRGVEIGGAAKNVLAIAAGIVQGRKLGASAAAALTTRGFAELSRFGRAFGAKPETLTGLSGLGDLILTCSSPQSRNFSLGIALGEGGGLKDAREKLAEGVFTAPVLAEMAATRGIDMPIASAVAAVIEGRLSVDAAIESLLTRPFKAEG
jgi:glycerol-3-phosphate dehydrogenase (NAD(P)+)